MIVCTCFASYLTGTVAGQGLVPMERMRKHSPKKEETSVTGHCPLLLTTAVIKCGCEAGGAEEEGGWGIRAGKESDWPLHTADDLRCHRGGVYTCVCISSFQTRNFGFVASWARQLSCMLARILEDEGRAFILSFSNAHQH